jgi:hypothetical protein
VGLAAGAGVVVAAELQEAEDVRWKTNSFFKRDYLEVQKINRCSIYVDMHVLL